MSWAINLTVPALQRGRWGGWFQICRKPQAVNYFRQMAKRGWLGPSHFDDRPDSYGDDLMLPLGTRVLREAMTRLRELAGRPRDGGAAELLDALERLRAIELAVNAEKALLIAELLATGGTWQKAADACKAQKQTLHKAFKDKVNSVSRICNDTSPEKVLRVMDLLHPQAVARLIHLGHVDVQAARVNGRRERVLQRNMRAITAEQRVSRSHSSDSVKSIKPQALRSFPLPRRPSA
ncbi:hypothetical protein OG226_41255 [Streptomyces sp. NBC_01261]|uniref:hypothetical protein n=1 Tax=Streptomyces sp. NBC_01261 TaxID=2903802 RepID=UPI002E371C0C|nr:hypothetical protein [Streptomyces sp. NBC_01261]